MKTVGLLGRRTSLDHLFSYFQDTRFLYWPEDRAASKSFLKNIDEGWLLSSPLPEREFTDKIEIIQKVADAGKPVQIYTYLKNEELRSINSAQVQYIRNEAELFTAMWHEIETPIIACGGFSTACNSFEAAVRLHTAFQRIGYHAVMVSTKKEASLFGGNILPRELFDSALPENQKARVINCFFNKLASSTHADLFVVDLPDSVVPYDEKYFDLLGLQSYEMFRASGFDCIVADLFAGKYSEAFFSALNEKIAKFYGNAAVFYTMNSFAVDQANTIAQARECLFQVSEKYLAEILPQQKSDFLFDIHDEKEVQRLAETILTKLS